MDTLRDVVQRSTAGDTASGSGVARDDRDERFKQLLREQFGKSGVSLLVLYSFVMIVAMLLLTLVSVSFATGAEASRDGVGAAINTEPVLVL